MVEFEEDIKKCLLTLEKGDTILYPTDTVWGLGCDALNGNAIKKIFILKHRPKEKSLIILLAEPREIIQYIATPHPDIIDILEQFDRPTTVIYDHPLGFPEAAVHENGSIAIRITSDPFCKALIKRFKKPIISTSANISGHPTPQLYRNIDKEITDGVDYIVKYRQNDETIRSPSRLVRLKEDGTMDILRP